MDWSDRGDNMAAGSGTPARPVALITTATERVALDSDDVVVFGSASHAHLRVGSSPIEDHLVAPVAGMVFVHRGRVVVANHDPRFAFDIAVETRALGSLSPGDWHSPVEPSFTVVVHGTLRYELHISSIPSDVGLYAFVPRCPTSRERADSQQGENGGGAKEPSLTGRQCAILDAYVAPMADGLRAATHQEVAETIGQSRQTVRVECARIFDAFLSAGIPMRDRAAAHDAISDAWARHRL